jgi:predicted RNA-binding protein with PIN domain
MRWLIDGYNVMHADGRLPPHLGREGFRRARRRFLDDLAAAFGPRMASSTTVVFDATRPPGDFPIESSYRGLALVFALGDENADARIEQLITAAANPKDLTVISSDRRIRLAAKGRQTRSLTAQQFWVMIDRLKERPKKSEPTPTAAIALGAELPPTPEESAFWVEAFGDVNKELESSDLLAPNASLLTDDEIAELEREIDAEA